MTETYSGPLNAVEPTYNWRAIYIQAAFIDNVDAEFIYSKDWAAPGYYKVMVPSSMDDMTAAACAMGGFHSTVPIKHLYMFAFTVYDDESGNSELRPDRDQDWRAGGAMWQGVLLQQGIRQRIPRRGQSTGLSRPPAL